MQTKQRVQYDPSMNHTYIPQPGSSAIVGPIDHPSPLVSNIGYVHTSTVQSYDPQTGIFETKNTIYTPIPW